MHVDFSLETSLVNTSNNRNVNNADDSIIRSKSTALFIILAGIAC